MSGFLVLRGADSQLRKKESVTVSTMIRLSRRGKHKRPFYRIVVADSRMPRDGRFLEILGTYDPLLEPPAITLKPDRVKEWIGKGAQVSQTVTMLLKREGLFKEEKAAE